MAFDPASLNRTQQWSLVLLRTLIGWHFLYEGFVKLWLPAWSRDGVPLAAWSAAGYLKAASGPFADLFRGLAGSGALKALDTLIPITLLLVGLSLTLGLFTRIGAWGAVLLLALFYLAQVPTAGIHQPGAEGAYLLVSKNLIEAAAVLVLLVFRTEEIVGLDLLREGAFGTNPASLDGPQPERT